MNGDHTHDCEPFEPTMPTKPSEWYRINCFSDESKTQGFEATKVKLEGPLGEALHFCGIKVYGYQTEVFYDEFSQGTQFSVAIDVKIDGTAYTVD